METERRVVREDLAALRLDREVEALPRRPIARWGVAVGIALVFLLALYAVWALTLGRVAQVHVAYAKLARDGTAPAGEVLTGSGYVVTADRYISLGVRVPSRIEAYLVEEGQAVEAGQVLVRLDGRAYEAALRESRAQLALARANLDLQRKELLRSQELSSRNVLSQSDLDLADNRVRVAAAEVERWQAEVARHEVDLDDTVIRAPTGGVILEKLKEVGEIAVPGGFAGSGELVRMANLEDLRAELDVNEADLARVHLGQPARIVPDAYPDRRYEASVVKLYPQINRQKGTLRVEVKILAPDAWLRPDMSVRVTFLSESPAAVDGEKTSVLAPRAAVRRDDGKDYAWVVREGRLRRQPLEIAGPAGSDQVIVASGLAGGEALVVGDVAGLVEGQAVETLPDGK
jgi:RND family efflux transporter MFP subunit